jgi:hypothetical protein
MNYEKSSSPNSLFIHFFPTLKQAILFNNNPIKQNVVSNYCLSII